MESILFERKIVLSFLITKRRLVELDDVRVLEVPGLEFVIRVCP
jgi:hypothetical protein